jgi:hypothetical protein
MRLAECGPLRTIPALGPDMRLFNIYTANAQGVSIHSAGTRSSVAYPGSGAFLTLDPGFRINIPDPQHSPVGKHVVTVGSVVDPE